MSESTNNQTISQLSARLWRARHDQRPISPLTKETPSLTTQQGYAIAWHGMSLRQEQGESIVGYKMGLTSEAKRRQMNLNEPIYGVLTDKMQLALGTAFDTSKGIHAKAEPEIAFHISHGFSSVPTPEAAFAGCDRIAPAIEILDSRFEGFKYFSLPDVIADNSSSSHFLIGEALRRDTFVHWEDLSQISMQFKVGNTVAQQAMAAEISGNPILSIVALCELFLSQGRTVPPNCWVLAGAATAAVALEPQMTLTLQTDRFSPLVLQTR
jgi:2-oxo-3-hexenedioate decarboxylase